MVAFESPLLPMALTARTRNEHVVPFVSPVITRLVVGDSNRTSPAER